MDIKDIAKGIADTVKAATQLRVEHFVVPDLSPPYGVVVVGELARGSFRQSDGGINVDATFELHVYTQSVSAKAGQVALYDYASFNGTKSIWKAIDDTKSLGLTGVDAAVVRYRPLGIEEISAFGYFGGMFDILVTASGA